MNLEQKRAYQREWIANRRKEYLDGKSCVKCGSTDRLEIDHIDPKTKVTNSVWSWSQTRRDEELAKCQVLCYDCHREKTQQDMGYEFFTHGTRKMYKKHKCRCDECKAWNTKEMQRYRNK